MVTFVNFFSWQWSTMVWQWSLLSFCSAGNGQQWSGNGDLSFFKLAMVNNDLVMVTFVILWNWQWLTMVWKWWPLLDKLFKMTIVRHHCLTIANHGRPWFDHGWRWYHGFIFAGVVISLLIVFDPFDHSWPISYNPVCLWHITSWLYDLACLCV